MGTAMVVDIICSKGAWIRISDLYICMEFLIILLIYQQFKATEYLFFRRSMAIRKYKSGLGGRFEISLGKFGFKFLLILKFNS